MPVRQLTPEEQEYARSQGMDPSQLTVIMPDAPVERTSALPAAARSFGAAALPTIGGGLAAGLTTAALAGAPETGGLTLLALPLIAGIAGGAGVGAAQNAVMPDSWKQKLADDAREHPYASEAGQLATLPLGGFKPSLTELREAGQFGINKLLGTTGRNIGKQAAINAGVGATLGATQEGVIEKIRGEDLSAGEIAKQAAIGAVFNKPNKLGEKYGFPAHTVRPIDTANPEFKMGAAEEDVTTSQSGQKVDGEPVEATTETQGELPVHLLQKGDEGAGRQVQTPTVEEINQQLKGSGYTGQITPDVLAAYRDLLAEHGIPLEEAPLGGVKGYYDPAGKKIAVNSAPEVRPGVDTIPHELAHHIWTTLPEEVRNNFTEKVRPQVEKINADREAWNAENPAKKMRPSDAEEFFASEMGAKAAIRAAEGGNTGFGNWLADFKAQLRAAKPGAEADDIYRSAMVDLMNGKTPIRSQVVGVDSEKKEQPEGEGLVRGSPEQRAKEKEQIAAIKARNKAELQAIREQYASGQGRTVGRTEGSTFATQPEDRRTFSAPSPEMVKIIERNARQAIGHFIAKIPDLRYLQPSDRDNIISTVKERILAGGVDADGLQRTTWRRTNQALNEALEEAKRNPKTSLNKKFGSSTTELGDIIGKAPVADELPAESAASEAATPAEETPIDQTEVPAPERPSAEGIAVSDDTGDKTAEEWIDTLAAMRKQAAGKGKLTPEISARFAEAEKFVKKHDLEEFVDTDELMGKLSGRKNQSGEEGVGGDAAEYKKLVEELKAIPNTVENFNKKQKINIKQLENRIEALQKAVIKQIPKEKWTDNIPEYGIYNSKGDILLDDTYIGKEGEPPSQTISDIRQYIISDRINTLQEKVNAFHGRYGGDEVKNQGVGEGVTVSQKYNTFRTKAELEAARDKAGLEGKPVADAIQNFFPARDQYYGKYSSKPLEKLSKLTPTDRTRILNTMYREDTDGKFYRNQLTPKQQAAYDAIRQALKQKQIDQRAAGQMVRGIDKEGLSYTRLPQQNPHYMPSMLRADILEQLVEHKGDFRAIQNRFLQYWQQQGATPEAANTRLKALMSAGDSRGKNETRFGANRLVEGLGLPPEYRLNDINKLVDRYFSRVAVDRAWFDQMENNPAVMEALKDSHVKHIFEGTIEDIKGEAFDKTASTIGGLNRVFTSAMLGPLTNVHIGMSTLFNPMQYLKMTELATSYGSALSSLSKARKESLENGYKRRDLNTIADITSGTNTFTQKLGALSSLVGKVSGREWTDVASKTFAQAISDEIIPRRLADARRGDKYAQKMMLQLDSEWTPNKPYDATEQSKLASTLAGFIHGAHDARTLPAWMNRESVVKPFFSLMSWSVSQTNQWMKHVWEPAMKGNLQPLLLSSLGAAVGGYVIQQMRQAISDKKSAIPSLQEIAQSSRGVEGNIPLLAYNFMQMASFTGFAGLGSVLGKDLFDMAYKNIPQGSTFPLDEVAANLAETVAHAGSAWMQTPDTTTFFEVFPRAMLDLVKENVQSARIATNWAADAGVSTEEENYKFGVSKETGNLRRHKMTEGMPYGEQSLLANNPYLNVAQKHFKHEQSIPEAIEQLPRLLEIAQQRSGGNPEILKEQWRSLKQNSYQTMPSLEREPLQFAQYYEYLNKTQGPEKARQLLMSYLQHNMINRVKASMVP